jgi:two-component system response regulator ResD
LIVEDEPAIAEVVERYLRRDGHEVEVTSHGERALRSVEDRSPSLVILDLGLPDLDGLEVCRRIRKRSALPIIVLSARAAEVDKLRGLEAGADDYVTKPFSARELAARVTAVLRRASAPAVSEGELQAGRLRLDPLGRRAWCGERTLALTVREFDLLFHLASHPGRVFSRGDLIDAIWGSGFTGGDATITVHVRRLREKVEDDPSRPRHLSTVWGLGYKFEP